jgi:uncharacterized sulfatase
MTGKHTGHTHIRGNREHPSGQEPLPDSVRTLADVLKGAGYATGAFGKWGLGGVDTEGTPARHGFDEFFGYYDQRRAHFYWAEFLHRNADPVELPNAVREEPRSPRAGPAVTRAVFTHDTIVGAALDFLDRHRRDRFFLYVPVTIPHAELQAPEDAYAPYVKEGRSVFPETPFAEAHYGAQAMPHATYAAMVSRLDRDVGRILDRLRELGLDRNTLVLFTSDNGPSVEGGSDPAFFRSAGPFRGVKRDVYEGGIRVPMLAWWPGRVAAGRTDDTPWALWDLLPTLAELAGARAPGGLDGISMLPTLVGSGTQRAHPPFYWEFHEQGTKQAARDGRWKGVRRPMLTGAVELYDLEADPGETRDLAARHPDVAARLARVMDREHVPSPLWQAPAEQAPRPAAPRVPNAPARPNVVVLLADDLGYGDLASYGHPTIRTPNLDRMAAEGLRLTAFYAQPVCTPSRAALLTGRYPIRSGTTKVFFPHDSIGLPASEVTLAEALKGRGYRTLAVGKWHLGHLPAFLPTTQGFDAYFGIPYSNDMDRGSAPPIPLMRGARVVEQPAEQATLTRRYTEEAIRFLREHRREPVFLYLAYTMPHLPLHVSPAFAGRSRAGRYGDVVEEIDWSVGQVLRTLKELGTDRNTLVIFASDNGPWSNFPRAAFQEAYGSRPEDAGSAGPLRGAKMGTYEGGVRVPAIVRWPGTVPAGRTSAEPASTLDLFPTLVRLAGGQVPDDRPLDGRDILPLLAGRADSLPTRPLYYYRNAELEGVREGRWKLRLTRHLRPELRPADPLTPELFDLDRDPGEHYNVAAEHPDVVARLRARMEAFAREAGGRLVDAQGTAQGGDGAGFSAAAAPRRARAPTRATPR